MVSFIYRKSLGVHVSHIKTKYILYYMHLFELCSNQIPFLFYSTDNAKDKSVMTGSRFRLSRAFSFTVLLLFFHNYTFIVVFQDFLQSCLNLPLFSL